MSIVGDEIAKLENPLDVMYLIHKVLRAEAVRAEKMARGLDVDCSLQAFKLAFNSWATALVFHADQEDVYITGPINGSRPTNRNGTTQGLTEIVKGALLAQEDEAHVELMEAVEDVLAVLNEDIGRTHVITRTKQHLFGKVVSMRIVQEDHLDSEESLIMPLARERLDERQQLEAAKALLIDELADDKRWVINWMCQDLTPVEQGLLLDLEKSFSESPASASTTSA